MLRKKSFILLSIISFILTGISPAFAHDGTVGETSPIEFYDVTPYEVTHIDDSPWKGFFMIYTKNNTGTAWSGFNFELLGSQVVFIDTALYGGDCSWAFDGDCQPHSSQTISSYSISPNQRKMSVYFNSDLVNPNAYAWFRVYTDNTQAQQNFMIKASPVLVPEPISSTLFILGGATLGLRRFIKKKNS